MLPPEIRRKRALLIIDGAPAHSCPWALELLKAFGVIVLTLPAHSSHLLQMFDVVLAPIVKKQFSKKCAGQAEWIDPTLQSNASRQRFVAMSALQSAWCTASGISQCRASARATGMYPFSIEKVLESSFVVPNEIVERLERIA